MNERHILKPRSRHQSIQVEPGDDFKYQWPQINSVYIAKNLMVDLLAENPIALVSEKLDGSNLSVSSNGVVASRRKIILTNAEANNQLNKTKFAGKLKNSVKLILNVRSVEISDFYYPSDFS